jgi:hypothetical protein
MDASELAAIVELVEGEYLLGPSDARRLVAAVRALTLANAELCATVRAALEAKNELETFYKLREHNDEAHARLVRAWADADDAVWRLFPDLEEVNP